VRSCQGRYKKNRTNMHIDTHGMPFYITTTYTTFTDCTTTLNIHPSFSWRHRFAFGSTQDSPRRDQDPVLIEELRFASFSHPDQQIRTERHRNCKAESGGGAYRGGCLSFRQRGLRTPADALDFGSLRPRRVVEAEPEDVVFVRLPRWQWRTQFV
jgi:hypothetical protein